MFLLLLIIFVLAIIAMVCLLRDDCTDNIWTAFIMNLFIFIISLAGMIHIISSIEDKEHKITNTSKNTKDSIIVKDSLLILNMNDTTKVFNINKI